MENESNLTCIYKEKVEHNSNIVFFFFTEIISNISWTQSLWSWILYKSSILMVSLHMQWFTLL